MRWDGVHPRVAPPHATRLALTGASALAIALVLLARPVMAHGQLGSRFDAPVPLVVVLLGAGMTVGGTAAVLATTGRSVSVRRRRLGRLSPSVTRLLCGFARYGFFALFVAALVAGLTGRQVAAENFATVLVWPLWVKGLVVVTVVVGSPWPVVSPWRTVYDWLCRLDGGPIALRPYPEWLGDWPAVVGFVVLVGVVENLTIIPRSPRLTVGLVAVYAAVMLLLAVSFGERALDRADTFAVLYDLFGRVSLLTVTRTADGGADLVLRVPWDGPRAMVSHTARAAFVVAVVYTVSFDGAVETPEYQTVAVWLGRVTGLGPVVDLLVYLVGLGVFVWLFVLVARTTSSGPLDRLVRVLAPTVLPIAVAYELAHNLDYVLVNAGLLVTLVTERLGVPVTVDPLAGVPLSLYWGLQVVLVVGGHLVAVGAAHAVVRTLVADERADGDTATLRAHVPLTLAMVGYTALSLWIVSRPVVT